MKISVVTPVHNAEKFVEKAVTSALDQPEVSEMILVEDGSSDGSLDLCKILEKNYPKVHLYMHEQNSNKGAGASRNLGIRHANCEFIAFLDADDFFLENRFQKTVETFQKYPSADGVYECIGTHFYSESGKKNYLETMSWAAKEGRNILLTTVDEYISPENLFETLLVGNSGWFSGDGLTVRRSLFEKCGYFDTSLQLSQDTEMWYRMVHFGKLYPGEIKEPVAKRGVHDTNRSIIKKDLYHHRVFYWKKMMKNAVELNLGKRCTRIIILRSLDHYNHRIQKTFGIRRKVLKLLYLAFILIKNPVLIIKFLM